MNNKFKLILLKSLNIVATITLILSAGLSLMGFVTLLPTEFSDWLLNTVPILNNLNNTDILTGSLGLGALAGSGGVIKLASNEVKKVTNIQKIKTQMELDALRQELADSREDVNNLMELVVPALNSLTTSVNQNNKLTQESIDYNVISANRLVASNLVSDEEKINYKRYINNIASRKSVKQKKYKINSENIIEPEVEKEEPVVQEDNYFQL